LKDIKLNESGSVRIPAYLVVFLIMLSATLGNLLGIWMIIELDSYPGDVLGAFIIAGSLTTLFKLRDYYL